MLFKTIIKTRTNTCKGFTFIESLVTLSIIGIVSAFALPAYSNFSQQQQQITSRSIFIQSVIFARAEAAKRHDYIVICPSYNGTSCLMNSKDFTKGWISFVNTDRDYPIKRDDNEEILQVINFKNNILKLKSNRKAFTFRPSSKRNTNGTMMFCPNSTEPNKTTYQAIIISYTGRPRVNITPTSQHIELCSES